MPDRSEQPFRWLGLLLVALIAWQILRAGYRANPFARLKLPPVPQLETNALAAVKPPATIPVSAPTKAPAVVANGKTNVPSMATNNTVVTTATNSVAAITNVVSAGSNSVAAPASNLVAQTAATNRASAKTNALTVSTNSGASTNAVALNSTNSSPGTNQIVGKGATNSASPAIARGPSGPIPAGMPPGMPMMGGGFPGMPGMVRPAAPLPKDIQARVDKIVDSELFAPVMRPLPMQLFGIAGGTALLRTDSGQSGLVKEGDSLGNVKLLRIGTNRVLVEVDGQKKELTIFDGYGGESLMPK